MNLDHSFISLAPFIITLVISLYSINAIIGLFVGVLAGVFLLNGFNPINAIEIMVKDYLVAQITNKYNATVIVLLIFIGGFVRLMEKSGGGSAFANKVSKYVSSKRKAQLFAWMGGIFIFYSDSGTPLIIGPVFRSLFDKMKLSRQKLAFIIDSTSSPVAILVPFIGWGVYIISLIDKELNTSGVGMSFELFVSAIPFQFYAILAICIVPWLTIRLIDFGSMATSEKATKNEIGSEKSENLLEAFTHKKTSTIFVFIPLFVLATTLLISLVPRGFLQKPISSSLFLTGLATSYFFASVSLILLTAFKKVRGFLGSVTLYLDGMSAMLRIVIILVLAWSLSVVGNDLGAPEYIADLVKTGVPAWLLPAVVFILGSIISFASGSSWGTFAILFPLAIPIAITIDAPLVVTIASVLSGGLFGDHCSPISETTILSSTGAGCSQFSHFRTQLSYALMNGIITFITYLFAGIYPNPLLCLFAVIAQLIILQIIIRLQLSKNSSSKNFK